MEIVRKLLTADELTPKYIRYVAETDSFQISPDGGVTWVDAPAIDPRTAPGFRAPANATADPRCNAAANMVEVLHQMVDALGDGGNKVSMLAALLAIFLLLIPFGWIADVLLVAVDALIVFGITPFVEAMDEDAYAAFLCIFYENIDADGQMSDSQLSDIYAAVETQLGGTVSGGFGTLSGGFGAVGWSNAGALGTITDADCSDCAPDIITDWQMYDITTGEPVTTDVVYNGGISYTATVTVLDGGGGQWLHLGRGEVYPYPDWPAGGFQVSNFTSTSDYYGGVYYDDSIPTPANFNHYPNDLTDNVTLFQFSWPVGYGTITCTFDASPFAHP